MRRTSKVVCYGWFISPRENNLSRVDILMFISYEDNNILVLLYKSNKTIWMFHEKFVDERDNPVNDLNIHNVNEDNNLTPVCNP
jgi:hypothetical protein